MCGINGIYAYRSSASPVDAGELARTRDYMAPRGPDGKGSWISEDRRIGLAHRRLAIIDLTNAGAQPMASADGRYIVTFNGEIYNYRALRAELEKKGILFHSQSDTEILLYLYETEGAKMVCRLRGMFAFAIWDNLSHQLFLARDPFGIKPLYYADDGKTLRFASQVKALLAGGTVSRDPEPAGFVGFCMWGSVPEPFTIYRNIRQLPAGNSIIFDPDGIAQPTPFYSIAAVHCAADHRRNQISTAQEQAAEIRAGLLDSVRHHLVSDVPVGAFLSAGIDSGALVGLMRDAGQVEIETVTLAFDEFRGQEEDEAPLAAQVAETYGTRHATRVVTRSEFDEDLPRIIDAMDQPSIDGVNTWFVSKAAKERGLKVAVSGLGGDELFGGYPSFRDVPRWVAKYSAVSRVPFVGAIVRNALGLVGAERWTGSAKAAGMLEYCGSYAGAYFLRRGLFMPWELEQVLGAELAKSGLKSLGVLDRVQAALVPEPPTAFGRVAAMESSLYMRNQLLRDTDWASMAHSLEVRVPLVDTILHERIAPFVDSGLLTDGKQALASAPAKPLPTAVIQRKKTGFGVPMGTWALRARRGAGNLAKTHSKGSASRDWSKILIQENLK